MKKTIDKHLFNISDKVILLYGTPLILLPISYVKSFNFSEKLSLALLFVMMLIGLELIFRSHKSEYKRIYKRKRKVLEDLNISFSLFLTPQVIVTSMLASITGGILGFYFIHNDIFSFFSIALMFFIIILGLEFLFQDLLVKIILKQKKVETKNKSQFESNFIEYLGSFTPPLRILLTYPTVAFYSVLGLFLTYNFYDTSLFSLCLGSLCFAVVGYGIHTLTSSK